MVIRAISDLHGRLPSIEPCDILVIAGDICGHHSNTAGSRDDCHGQADWLDTTFRLWLKNVPADQVVATWGNHDWVGQRLPEAVPADLPWTLLVDAGARISGVRFWGSPWSPFFNRWAFNAPPADGAAGEPFLRRKWEAIAKLTDVLIVHGPPYGFGDEVDGRHVGSVTLADRIAEVRPVLSLHGHIHNGHGKWQAGATTIANVSVLDDDYRLVRPATTFEL